jgi:hypothetical protein
VRGLIKRLKRRFVSWLLDVEELKVPSQLKVGNTISITGDYIDMERLTSDPSAKEGRLYYRSDLKRLRYMDGTTIIELLGADSSTQSLIVDFIGLKSLSADPSYAGGRVFYRSDLERIRAMAASKTIDLLGIETDTGLLTHDTFRFRALTSEPTLADGLVYYRSDQKILKITDGTRKIGLVPVKALRAGRWYGTFDAATAFTTVTISANTLYASPFFVPEELRFDQIAINVTTAGAGGTVARVGIYKDGSTPSTQGYPANLIPGTDVGELAVDTTGVKANAIDVTLPPGLYWLALVSSGAPALRGVGVASLDSEILGLGDDLGTAPGVGYSVSYTYGALPSTFPSGASIYTSTVPLVALRRA